MLSDAARKLDSAINDLKTGLRVQGSLFEDAVFGLRREGWRLFGKNDSSSLFVDYSFRSDRPMDEPGIAELIPQESGCSLLIPFVHRKIKRVKVFILDSDRYRHPYASPKSTINTSSQVYSEEEDESEDVELSSLSELLHNARSTLFECELFSALARDAMTSRFPCDRFDDQLWVLLPTKQTLVFHLCSPNEALQVLDGGDTNADLISIQDQCSDALALENQCRWYLASTQRQVSCWNCFVIERYNVFFVFF